MRLSICSFSIAAFHVKCLAIVPLLLVVLVGRGAAGTIQCVGVIGNSGVAGPGLLRVDSQLPSGAAIDDEHVLWLGCGSAVARVGLDGHEIERFALMPPGSRVDSRTFATLNDSLYFFGTTPDKVIRLFSLPMHSGALAEPVPVTLPPRDHDYFPYVLSAQPLDGKLLIATRVKGAVDPTSPVSVLSIDPAARSIQTLFRTAGDDAFGLAVDGEHRVMYVGTGEIRAYRPDGETVAGFPVPAMKTPAIPTTFFGHLSFADGALWDIAHYGFISRHDLKGEADPGRVIQWSHDLGEATQVLELRHDHSAAASPLLVTCSEPGGAYFCIWDRAAHGFVRVRRIGCLPTVTSLGLSSSGAIVVGTDHCTLWYHWEEAADAVPAKVEMNVATTPLIFTPDGAFTLGEKYHLGDNVNRAGPRPMLLPPQQSGSDEGRSIDIAPARGATGLCVQPAGALSPVPTLFITDIAKRQLLRVPFIESDPLGSRFDACSRVEIEGATLNLPSDVAALPAGRLAIADGGSIVILKPDGARFALERRITNWGVGPLEHFGDQLWFASDTASVVVSDKQRHRVLWFDASLDKLVAVFGKVDEPGDALDRLNLPGHIAVSGSRAVVADTGNQRVLRLTRRAE